jgi:hypothetical protein
MPQPSISGTPPTLKFGGLALPNGQGTMTQVNLNDLVNWFWMDWPAGGGDDDFPLHAVGHFAWRAKGAFLGQDAKGRAFKLPMRYIETNNPLGLALALLSQGGIQNLTTDNSTAINCKYAGARRAIIRRFQPYYWSVELQFIAPTPWFSDLSTTTYINALALNSGSVTNTNVTYLGSVFAEPVYTLNIPNTNPATIASFVLANTMAGETLTINFPTALAASTTWAITIDAGAMTAKDQNGKAYDVSGTFPNFYPPAGQVQQIQSTLTPGTGTATGCTLTATATNRWEV